MLTLWDLILYGIVLIQPIAPVGIFGVASKLSRGHVSTTILVAMVAMMLTAFSYGRMAALYPWAGSAYTYVGRGLNAHLGFLAGWAMVLDYLVVPIINTVYGALTIQRLIPAVPYVVWVGLFAGAMTLLNLRGIRATARANMVLLAVMSVVVAAFVFLAIRYLLGLGGWNALFSLQPFYDPKSFDYRSVSTATSLAALTYIGFDGVTTLAEDAQNPTKNVLRATVLVCLFTGILSTLEIYLAQRVWPDYLSFPNLETAFMDVTRRVGGPALFQAMAVILIIACLGSGLAGQVGAARLLFGMGRDNILPSRVFGHLDPGRSNPTYNVILIGILAFAGAVVLSYERAAEVLNFGAFLAFMGVNLAALRKYYLEPQAGAKRRLLADALVPGLGFLFCFWIWLSLPLPAKEVGRLWLLAGFLYVSVKTRGFRSQPVMMDFSES